MTSDVLSQRQRKQTELGWMPWSPEEVISVAREANKIAMRVGGRLVLSEAKLRALGLTTAGIAEVQKSLPEIPEMKIDY